jgi:short subunit dehydrogenase-like uncharacterized protein
MTDRRGERPLDLVLAGATGFTGGLVADELAARLARQSAELGRPVRWALAGRDADRLAVVAARVRAARPDAPAPGVEVVDAADSDRLTDLAARTRVVATTIGPYARVGEPLAAACAAAGTWYADITGEPAFVASLRAGHDATARHTGARLVTCCGFDSVPHDLGAAMTAGLLPGDAEQTVRGYVRASGRLSGGTAASALGAVADARTGRQDRGRSAAPGRDPIPGPRDSGQGGLPALRPAERLELGLHRVERLGGWGVPLPTIDGSIVLRSARVLPGYGSSFRYGHYALLRHLRTIALTGATLGGAFLLARTGPTRRLLAARLPQPGEGPDAQQRARGRFRVTFVGEGAGRTVVARVSGGDPGYTETSRMLAEAALALAFDDLPDVAGVVTPAVGLGAPYRARLEAGGLRFEVLGDAAD